MEYLTISDVQNLIADENNKIVYRNRMGISEIWNKYLNIVVNGVLFKDFMVCANCKKVFKRNRKYGTSNFIRHANLCEHTLQDDLITKKKKNHSEKNRNHIPEVTQERPIDIVQQSSPQNEAGTYSPITEEVFIKPEVDTEDQLQPNISTNVINIPERSRFKRPFEEEVFNEDISMPEYSRSKSLYDSQNYYDETGRNKREPQPAKLIDNEFETFATSIIAQLKNMPFEEALKLQLKIQALITEERLRFLDDCKRQGNCAEGSTQVYEPSAKMESNFNNYGTANNRNPIPNGMQML